MEWIKELARRTAYLFHRKGFDADLEEEMKFHIEMKAASYRDAGMEKQSAHYAARRQVGNTVLLAENSRQMWGWSWFETCLQDIRYALRGLRKSPGFAAVAIFSLALGIGANTVTFSALNALVLRDLPIKDPERVYSMNRSGGPSQSFPNYRDIRDRNSVFESLFATRISQFSIGDGNGAQMLWGFLVTGNYFESLGVKPVLGRFFGPAEDRVPGGSPYAVLSYSLWQRRFGGDSQIVGKTVPINGLPYTITGVAPRDFHGTEVFYWSDIWVPMMMQGQIESYFWLEHRNSQNCWVSGRLKPNVTSEQAESNLKIIANQLAREYKFNEGMKLTLTRPGLAGDWGRKPMTAFMNGLMLLAVLVLLAACVNLAGLLSARASDRSRELAIRVSIGAGRGRVVRQLITESLVISLLGGLAGCVLGLLILQTISYWRLPLDLPIHFDVNPDWRVFLIAFTASLLAGVLVSVGAARQAWKTDPSAGMKGTIDGNRKRRLAFRDLLLPVQVTLCCVLVVASLVAARGTMRSFQTPLGFRPDGVAVAGYNVSLAGYKKEAGRVFQKRAFEAMRRIPGVISVAHSNSVPLSLNQSHTTIYSEGTTDFRPKNSHGPIYYYVSPGYFRTIGTSLLSGREFTAQEHEKSPRVAIINQTLARRVVGTTNAVGRRILWGPNEPIEIIGVVEDGKYETLTETPKGVIYLSFDQNYSNDALFVVRSNRPEAEVAAEMRNALVNLDSQVPIFSVGGLRQMLALAYSPMKAALYALGTFGVLAAMLAATGVYGISAYTVSRRVREIGIRMAIGAQQKQILKLIFGRTGVLVASGATIGLALGVAGAKLLEHVVYQANARDPIVIASAVISIAVVAIAAAWGPAKRALTVDPVHALRSE